LDHTLPPAKIRTILDQNVELEKVIYDGYNESKIRRHCSIKIESRHIDYSLYTLQLQYGNDKLNMYAKNSNGTYYYQLMHPVYNHKKSTPTCKCVTQSQLCPVHSLPYVDFTALGINGVVCENFDPDRTITLQNLLSSLIDNGICEPKLGFKVMTEPDIASTESKSAVKDGRKDELKMDVTVSMFVDKNERQDKLDQMLDSITSDLFYSRRTKKIYLLDELNELFKVESSIYDLNLPSNSEIFYVRGIRIYILPNEIDQLFYFVQLRGKLNEIKTLKPKNNKMKPSNILIKLMGIEIEGM
jgi:hypothetical protein